MGRATASERRLGAQQDSLRFMFSAPGLFRQPLVPGTKVSPSARAISPDCGSPGKPCAASRHTGLNRAWARILGGEQSPGSGANNGPYQRCDRGPDRQSAQPKLVNVIAVHDSREGPAAKPPNGYRMNVSLFVRVTSVNRLLDVSLTSFTSGSVSFPPSRVPAIDSIG
jgi:hypothetical protein